MVPCVIVTWRFGEPACKAALDVLETGGSALDAVEAGANVTEEDPEVRSVGYGGVPNRDGIVELDAAIMDGQQHAVGAVCAMPGIRRPISVARLVMERTPHCMLAGGNAKRFALSNGWAESDLLTADTRARYAEWRARQLAPQVAHFDDGVAGHASHDTIGICALDAHGALAAGCTTSGLAWKTPGRVGDSPIVGSGLYVDDEVGAAAATGNGDEIMKVCLSYRVVLEMERGVDPQAACERAAAYLLRKRPAAQSHGAACIALRRDGAWGAAATREGFEPGKRPWIHVFGSAGAIRLSEGSYVLPDGRVELQ
jgi:L-asparaginase/N4-(beta-N-acetylglucosaminyl)-L-asparaginase